MMRWCCTRLPSSYASSRTLKVSSKVASTKSNGDPLPFLGSKAHRLKVSDYYEVKGKRPVLQVYGIPFGIVGFTLLVYLGFFRPFDGKDEERYKSIISTWQQLEPSEASSDDGK